MIAPIGTLRLDFCKAHTGEYLARDYDHYRMAPRTDGSRPSYQEYVQTYEAIFGPLTIGARNHLREHVKEYYPSEYRSNR